MAGSLLFIFCTRLEVKSSRKSKRKRLSQKAQKKGFRPRPRSSSGVAFSPEQKSCKVSSGTLPRADAKRKLRPTALKTQLEPPPSRRHIGWKSWYMGRKKFGLGNWMPTQMWVKLTRISPPQISRADKVICRAARNLFRSRQRMLPADSRRQIIGIQIQPDLSHPKSKRRMPSSNIRPQPRSTILP